MSQNCSLCNGSFSDGSDKLLICNHHENAVHYGCCVSNCSQSGEPCQHCIAVFDKAE